MHRYFTFTFKTDILSGTAVEYTRLYERLKNYTLCVCACVCVCVFVFVDIYIYIYITYIHRYFTFTFKTDILSGSVVEYTRLNERLKNYTLYTALTSISDNSHSELSFANIGDKAPAVLPDTSRDKLLLRVIQSKVSKSKCKS